MLFSYSIRTTSCIFQNIDVSTCGGKNRPVSIWRRISRFDAVGMLSMVILCLIGIIIASDCMNHSRHLYRQCFGRWVFCCCCIMVFKTIMDLHKSYLYVLLLYFPIRTTISCRNELECNMKGTFDDDIDHKCTNMIIKECFESFNGHISWIKYSSANLILKIINENIYKDCRYTLCTCLHINVIHCFIVCCIMTNKITIN